MTPQIFLVASDTARTRLLRNALSEAGYDVHTNARLATDLILLALDHHFVARYRQTPGLERTPLLVWPEHPTDVAAVLHEGADDCVAADADLSEVLARI